MGEEFFLKLGENLSKLGDRLAGWLGEHIFNIVVILIGAWLIRVFAERFLNQLLRITLREDLYATKSDREKRLKTLSSLSSTFIRVVIYLVAAIMIIAEMGINTGPLLASAGVLGVALGFGAQSLIKDFVSGIFIITENQYRVGDVVKLGDVTGVVEGITIRTTIVRDLHGDLHHIPNGTITLTTNKTMGFGRINEDITVAFDTDLEQLAHVIDHVGEELAAMPEFEHKIKDPPKLASVRGFSKDGLVVKILGKTAPSSEWQVRSEMYKKLKAAFDRHKITLAGQPPESPKKK